MKKTVLLVDDSKTALMMERMLLGQSSYCVLEAHDGLEALEVAERHKPDVILMDVTMPRLDGLSAVQRLRSMDATRSIPVIMVTTRSEAANMQAGFQSGCTAYLTKPINGPELLAKLKEFLGE